MKINNNIQDPRIQQDNAMREDKGDPACDKTPPSSQPPTQQEDGGGRKKKPNMPRSYHLELVVHASYCNAPDCPQYRCRMMKKRLAHMRRQKGDTGDCRDCKVCPAMIRLLTDHAKLCPVRKTNYISSVRRGKMIFFFSFWHLYENFINIFYFRYPSVPFPSVPCRCVGVSNMLNRKSSRSSGIEVSSNKRLVWWK